MAFPQSPFARPRARPATLEKASYVFGIGSHAFVSDAGSEKGIVVLNDASGKVAVGHLADGSEVEILAWLPRRAATLYRVQSIEDRTEGWLSVANLRRERGRVPAAAAAPTK